MSTTTAPIFPEGPVTPDTLVALLRASREHLRDSSRDGQLLGMRIDEALSQWSATPPFVLMDESKIDIGALQAMNLERGAHLIFLGYDKPTAIPTIFAPPEDPE